MNVCAGKNKIQIFFALKPRAFLVFNKDTVSQLTHPIVHIENAIADLKKDLVKINKEYTFVHSVCEVEYRNKYGLIHTLPKKKITMFETTYPDIKKRIAYSKQKSGLQQVFTTPHVPKKVRFGTKNKQEYSKFNTPLHTITLNSQYTSCSVFLFVLYIYVETCINFVFFGKH